MYSGLQAVQNWDAAYQFLYVTYGHEVVGVGAPFDLITREESDDDVCFDVLENSVSQDSVLPYPAMPGPTRDHACIHFKSPNMYPGFRGDLDLNKLERRIIREVSNKRHINDGYETISPKDFSIFEEKDTPMERKRKIRMFVFIMKRLHDLHANV